MRVLWYSSRSDFEGRAFGGRNHTAVRVRVGCLIRRVQTCRVQRSSRKLTSYQAHRSMEIGRSFLSCELFSGAKSGTRRCLHILRMYSYCIRAHAFRRKAPLTRLDQAWTGLDRFGARMNGLPTADCRVPGCRLAYIRRPNSPKHSSALVCTSTYAVQSTICMRQSATACDSLMSLYARVCKTPIVHMVSYA